MRRLVLGIAAALLAVGMLAPAGASTFSDVPTDHWAYEAIDYLQQMGLVEGYPDNTFKGDRAFTRYEMAMAIARVFTKLQDWQAAMESGSLPGGENVDLSEVYTRLDRLSSEFRDELTDLGARMTAVEDEQARMRGDVEDLKALIKDSGLSGSARWRAGGYIATGSEDLTNEQGFETYIQMNYLFQPDPNLDFKLSLTASEIEGAAGTGYIPGSNNEDLAGTPPFGVSQSSSSFVVDEALFRYYIDGAPKALGDCPVLTGGRQYFHAGEFGLAGDNGYRSNFGVRYDTQYGANFAAHLGYYRMGSISVLQPWVNADSNSNQSSGLTLEGDDFLLAGLEYHSGEATVPGHDYKLVVRADGALHGVGAEDYIGISGNAELPFSGTAWVNGIRGEWVYVLANAFDQNPDDLGLSANSFIMEVDVYNDGNTRVSAAGAQIAQIEALPVLANVDNDPFSEWDFTVNATGDAFNMSREGRNYFPSDFVGFGVQAEHSFAGSLQATLTYYNGNRVDATASERPDMVRLNLRYPFSDNSQVAVDFIAAGERDGLEDPIGLIRGEFKLNF